MAAQQHEIDELVAHLRRPGAPSLLVTGTRGSGKSTLMNGLHEALESADLPLVFHTTEAHLDSCHAEDIVERISRLGSVELTRRGLKYRHIPQLTQFDNEPALPIFDFKGGILYVLIDGLDFIIDDNGFGISYFPVDLPPSMRLIVSVSHGPLLDSLASRGYRVHEMAPLSPTCKREILQPKMQGQADHSERIQRLLAWPPGKHPTHLLFAAKLAELTGQVPTEGDDAAAVLDRLIDAMGPAVSNLAMFGASKHGLPFKGIRDLTRMLRALPLIVQRGQFFRPAMPEVQQALRKRFSEAELRLGRIELAEQLATSEFGAVLDEAAQHLYDLEETDRLADFLTTFQVFARLIHRSSGTFARYWRKTGAKDTLQRFERMFDSQADGLDPKSRVALLNNIGLVLSECDTIEVAERFYRRSIEEARVSKVPQPGNLASGLYNLALLLARRPQHYADAEKQYLDLLTLIDGTTEEISLKKWKALESYATLLENMIRNEEAMTRRQEAITAARKVLGPGHPKVGELLLGLSGSIRWWNPQSALTCAEQGQAILEAAGGPRHSGTTWGLRMIALAHQMLGNYQQAQTVYERTLEIGRAVAQSAPNDAAATLNNLADALEETGNRQLGLHYLEAKLEHLRTLLGPNHADTVQAAYAVAISCDRTGQQQRALKIMEECLQYYTRLGQGFNYSRTHATMQLARMRLCSGDREACAGWLGEVETIAAEERPATCQSDLLLLKAELAAAHGYGAESRQLVEAACALHPMDYTDLQSQFGLVRTVKASLLHLADEVEASQREHEAGVQHLRFTDRYMLGIALRPYEASLRDHLGPENVARARVEELRIMFNMHVDSFGLAQFVLPPRPIRVAWNPKSPSILALLDSQGRSYLFDWHASASLLEPLSPPFAQVELPTDPALVSLNWSGSGEALRLCTPQGQQVSGQARHDEEWAPASAISPEGAYVAIMRRQSVRIAHTVVCNYSTIAPTKS